MHVNVEKKINILHIKQCFLSVYIKIIIYNCGWLLSEEKKLKLGDSAP